VIPIGTLVRYDRPAPSLDGYDRLLKVEGGQVTNIAAEAAIGATTNELHLPTVRSEALRVAEIGQRERFTHLQFLAELLTAEAKTAPNGAANDEYMRPGSPG
jgi:hypothetical protein